MPSLLPETAEVVWIDSVGSTHMLLKSEEGAKFPPYTLVAARRQSNGRGQRGNSWESEEGRNLTFSMAARPDWMRPSRQFAISEAVALAVVDLLAEHGIMASVKWPNDIYVADRKICGILIDHSLQGESITGSVISAGINVNQLLFRSDAPNPVSMLQLASPEGGEYDLESMARRIGELICTRLRATMTPDGLSGLHAEFMRRLYRNDGLPHPYRDNIAGEDIMALIEGVAPGGTLTLRLPSGERRDYAFKEITFLLDPPLK